MKEIADVNNNIVKNNKVVVIGAPGFLGTKLVESLKGREITCLVHPSLKDQVQGLPAKIVFADILQPRSEIAAILQGVKTVFNCAGIQHPKKTKEIYRVNTEGVVNLFEACQDAGVNNFIHISSSTIFGSNQDKIPLTENFPLKYHTHYTKSKIQADELLKQKARISPTRTRLIILAPAVFYGSPPSKNLAQLLAMIKSKKILPLMSKQGSLRSYINLNNVVQTMLVVENKGRNGETYLISDQKPLTTKEFYSSLAKGLGVEPKTLSLPIISARIAEKIALYAGYANIHLRNFNVLGEFGRPHFIEPKKAEKELGIKFNESSAPGLEEMARRWNNENTNHWD